MSALFAFTQINRVVCSYCGNRHDFEMKIYGGQELVIPSLPPGWFTVGRNVLCRAHTVDVVITIDGVLQPEGWSSL